jgi:hypothetical protein
VCRYGKLGSPQAFTGSRRSNNIAQQALTVKFISYRKSVKSHCQMKDLNKKSCCLASPWAGGLTTSKQVSKQEENWWLANRLAD